MGKDNVVKELWRFLKKEKRIWLAPLIIILLLLGFVLVVTEGSAVAPFIYALF